MKKFVAAIFIVVLAGVIFCAGCVEEPKDPNQAIIGEWTSIIDADANGIVVTPVYTFYGNQTGVVEMRSLGNAVSSINFLWGYVDEGKKINEGQNVTYYVVMYKGLPPVNGQPASSYLMFADKKMADLAIFDGYAEGAHFIKTK